MSRVTSVDLYMQYHKDTGKLIGSNNGLFSNTDDRFSDKPYCKFLEDKLLEKMNEEREVEELFNNTAII